MSTIEILVYGVFSGLLGGGLASLATFLLIHYNSKKIQKLIQKEAESMSQEMKLNGLDQMNSAMMGQSNKKPWN